MKSSAPPHTVDSRRCPLECFPSRMSHSPAARHLRQTCMSNKKPHFDTFKHVTDKDRTDGQINQHRPVRSPPIRTCAGLTTGVALFADVPVLKEALRTAFNTQLSALQLQERRRTGPAGLGSRSSAQLTGLVTFLTAGALSVIPGYMHTFISTHRSDAGRT